MADLDGNAYAEARVDDFVQLLSESGVTPEAAYLEDGRAVIRFDTVEDQLKAGDLLRDDYSREASIALTLTPKLPDWLRGIGLGPMSLGLDLRGGGAFPPRG